jgi:hypothetical protein
MDESAAMARQQVQNLATTDPARALSMARTVAGPWFRCQALAQAGRFAPASTVKATLDEAVAAAAEADDAYRRTAVLAWPIRAAIERGRIELATAYLRTALDQVPSVEPLASRAYALHLLWPAVFPAGPVLREPVWQAVVAHCPADRSWRTTPLYRQIAATLRSESAAEADRVLAVLPRGKTRNKLEGKLREERQTPRGFF